MLPLMRLRWDKWWLFIRVPARIGNISAGWVAATRTVTTVFYKYLTGRKYKCN